MRNLTWCRVLTVVVLVGAGVFSVPALGDLLVFFNGDFYYGQGTVLQPSGDVNMVVRGVARRFSKSQIQHFRPGINAPAPGQIVSVSDFRHVAAANIVSITMEITTRTTVTDAVGKEMVLDVENGFQINTIRLWPTTYAFYRRKGTFMTFILENHSDEVWKSVSFRAHLYDSSDRILSSKDFYVYRLPAQTPQGSSKRKIELDFPDIPYDLVHRMRVLRKF